MSISLSKLCIHCQKKYAMQLCAGSKGLNNIVRWVHMVEDLEVATFLHGEELVFTTGIGNISDKWLLEFVKSLQKNNVAGLVVNIGPYIEEIPQPVIAFCEAYDFPIFTLPWSVRVIDITFDFCKQIIAYDHLELSLKEAFITMFFNPEKGERCVKTLERSGFRKDMDYTVILLKSEAITEVLPSTKNYYDLIKQVKATKAPTAVFVHNKMMVVIHTGIAKKEREILKNFVEQTFGDAMRVGISNTVSHYDALPEAYKQAVSALRVTKRSKIKQLDYQAIGIYKVIFGVENQQILEDYVEEMLGEVIRYDKEKQADLECVLRSYFDNDSSVIVVSEELGIHRNTVNNKIKLIKTLLNTQLSSEDRAKIKLAFDIKNILDA